MNTTTAKYSIEELEGDTWEVRRTKRIVRAIIAAKQERKLTTEALAEACSMFLGVEGSVKVSTLNGLFAGKRKTISVTELEMFAGALFVPVVDLMYPPGPPLEVRPNQVVPSAEALTSALGAELRLAGTLYGVMESRSRDMLQLLETSSELLQDVVSTIGSIRRLGWEFSGSQVKFESLKWKLQEVRGVISRIERRGVEPVPRPMEDLAWLIDLDPRTLTPEMLLAGEPHLSRWTVGEYRLGSADGQHPEEA